MSAEPLPSPGLSLPISGPPWRRPDPATVRALHAVSAATASACLHRLGIRHSFVRGPRPPQERAKRERLAAGGSIWTYYPLSEAGQREYEAWKRERGGS